MLETLNVDSTKYLNLIRFTRSLAMWMVWNVPLGRLAPHVMGYAMNSKPCVKK